ncbi:MAG: methyltransferase domain-containing protein [Luteibaculum sp.]
MFSDSVFGTCLYDHYQNASKANIQVHSPGFDTDEIPTSYLFRTWKEMPLLEQIALERAKGKILDVGACAGVHSKELLKKGNCILHLVELDPLACQFLREIQGFDFVFQKRVQDYYSTEKYDCILLLMNGLGLAGNLDQLPSFLLHLKSLLSPDGKIIFESSDIAYLYDEVNRKERPYYGEMEYQVSYKEDISAPFSWLYMDEESLAEICLQNGLQLNILYRDSENNYLGEIC